MKVYLLDCSELRDDQAIAGLPEELYQKCDSNRQKKAERIRAVRERCISMAAGVLLQKVWRDCCFPPEDIQDGWTGTLRELLGEIPFPEQIRYRTGEQGKPYFEELPVCFSLSHSGDYVLCAVDSAEVGADIQWKKPGAIEPVAGRFFSKQEWENAFSLPEAERETYLYLLWTRKEAYGKLTGKGVTDCLRKNVADLIQVEYLSPKAPEGYVISICRFAEEEKWKGNE